MQVEAIDRQSYSLTLGRFGNFGFEVEPTIALRLLPEQEKIYRIETVRTGCRSRSPCAITTTSTSRRRCA